MSLIWNNKEYKLVGDDSVWNKLEFVVARKLYVRYKPTQVLSINFIKKSFEIYGAIERIEIFRDVKSETQFAHVTFKESRTAYLVLIDLKQNTTMNVESIRPADIHQQPDTLVGSSKSQFFNLPDKCLLVVFGNCEINTLATLSIVCKKFWKLLREQVFGNKFKFESVTTDDMEVTNALITAGRLVQCINPAAFLVKIYRNLEHGHVWPTISIDFEYTEKSRLFVEMTFCKTQWLNKLEPVSKRIETIHMYWSIYDILEKEEAAAFEQTSLWSNVTMLIVSGFSNAIQVPDFSSDVAALRGLETICIRNMFVASKIVDYCRGKHLRNIDFENCTFHDDISEEDIDNVVSVIAERYEQTEENILPLRIKFDTIQYYTDRVQSTYWGIKMALQNEYNHKYVRIQIGKDPISQ